MTRYRKIGTTYGLLAVAMAIAATTPGCIEIVDLLRGVAIAPGPGVVPPNDGLPTDGVPTVLAVQLSVSNPVPQANEEVRLTCRVTQGDTTGVTFAFQGGGGRLVADSRRGTARWVADASDIGIGVAFTCTATTPTATSQTSNRVTVITSP